LALAGLWEGWRGAPTERRCAASDRDHAGGRRAAPAARAPAVIEPERWPPWLGEVEGGATALPPPVRRGAARLAGHAARRQCPQRRAGSVATEQRHVRV